jgi:hypothetical protein
MNKWKLLGLAGLAGVAATGVIIARDERRRAQMTPEEVRARLRQRLTDVERGGSSDGQTPSDERDSGGSR